MTPPTGLEQEYARLTLQGDQVVHAVGASN